MKKVVAGGLIVIGAVVVAAVAAVTAVQAVSPSTKLTGAQCGLIAQINPVFVLVLVVDRDETFRGPNNRSLRTGICSLIAYQFLVELLCVRDADGGAGYADTALIAVGFMALITGTAADLILRVLQDPGE